MKIALAILGVCLSFSQILFGQAANIEITNPDVINMTNAGIGEQTIILTIQRGPVKFDTSPQALIALKKAGVSDQVLNAILAAAPGKVQAVPPAQSEVKIKDASEFKAYQIASTQGDPSAKAASLENFLQIYPQSVVKKLVLDSLVDAYQRLGDADRTLNAASRLLQIDPNSLKAIFVSVYIKKGQCAKTSNTQTCDDTASLANQGLAVAKPVGVSDDDWKKQTGATYPIFHSALALDDIVGKKDVKAGIEEYKKELMMYPPDATKSGPGLVDTLQLAEAYTKSDSRDLVQAIWLYARAWNFAPTGFKDQVEKKLEYYYKAHHGDLDGLDAVKARAQETVFPPENFAISFNGETRTQRPLESKIQSASQGFTLRVLQEQSVPYTQESGGGISTSCSIVGSASTSAYVNSYGNSSSGSATTTSNQRMNCNSYDTTIRWPHVLNVMFAQASNGNSYIIACDAAWRWSKCVPLRAGDTFNALFTEKGIEVQAISAKGKEENPTYHILQSAVSR